MNSVTGKIIILEFANVYWEEDQTHQDIVVNEMLDTELLSNSILND